MPAGEGGGEKKLGEALNFYCLVFLMYEVEQITQYTPGVKIYTYKKLYIQLIWSVICQQGFFQYLLFE